MAKSPERSVLQDVLSAHQLAGKIHVDGAKPLTRVGGAAAITVTGVALEMISSGSTALIQEKFPSIKFDTLPTLFQELLEDGVVAVVYAVANKQLNEPLPKLKLRHLTTSTLGTILVSGAEGVGGRIKSWRKSKTETKTAIDNASAAATSAVLAAAHIDEQVPSSDEISTPKTTIIVTEETTQKKSLLDYINPVTALGADEARMAVMDWYRAYKAVVAGTQDEFVKANKPKDQKEPTLTRETTMIYVVPDLAMASAMVNTTTGEAVTTS
ncbi:MAG: hypothetical protein Q8L37_03065 [Candidatus Gottesmanbacteria bacterium]|nr:hypothetical protein [Candidatus Gottesmanbacteria bacterium]